MTPANLLVLVFGPNCQRQSRQRFLESATAKPGSPGPHFTTAKLAIPGLQAGSQASGPTVYVYRGVLLPGGHTTPSRALQNSHLPLASSVPKAFLFSSPGQLNRPRKPPQPPSFLVNGLRFSYHITFLHTHLHHPTPCEARTDTRLNTVYFRPSRTRCYFFQPSSSSAPNTTPPPSVYQPPPATCLLLWSTI